MRPTALAMITFIVVFALVSIGLTAILNALIT